MSDPVPPHLAAPSARRPIWTIACWAILPIGALLTYVAYQIAYAHRSGGDWLPGMGELIVGTGSTVVVSFGFSMVALLRRERRCGWAWPPFLGGLGAILYFEWRVMGHR